MPRRRNLEELAADQLGQQRVADEEAGEDEEEELAAVAVAPDRAGAHRTCRKQVRTSPRKSSGCSKAAKCPPYGSSFQWISFVKRFSAQRRDARKISFGKIEAPVGIATSDTFGMRNDSQ